MAVRMAVAGAGGRMGRRIIALAGEDGGVQVVAALERAGHACLGRDAGELAGVGPLNLAVSELPAAAFDVLVDFTSPEGTQGHLALCREHGSAIVIGTTGHGEAQLSAIASAAKAIPVLKAANMSVGVNVVLRLAELLAGRLDAGFDVEIVEAHHRFKEDAPSGTALALCEAVQRGRAASGAAPRVVQGRSGRAGPRPAGEIGMHSLRIGDTVGEHVVHFGSLGETISIAHSAHSRDTFAAGALKAARWISGRPAGLYDMQQVLFGAE